MTLMTLVWRARLYELHANEPRRGRWFVVAVIAGGLGLLALLQNYFAVAAGLVGVGFLTFWAYTVFTHRIKRARWQRAILVVGAAAAAITYAFWRGSTVPAVAAGAIIVLLVRAYRSARTPVDADSPGFAAYLRTLMLISYAGLIFVWPRLGTYILVLVAAGVLIITGMSALLKAPETLLSESREIKDAATVVRRIRLSRSRLAGRIGLAGVIAAAGAVSFVVLSGSPEREVGEFYAMPEQLPEQDGQLIRFEPYTRGVPEGQEAWLILYSTRDHADAPTVGSAVVVAPQERPETALPTVSIAPGTNGVATHCAPSLRNDMFINGHEQVLVDQMVPQGWAGVITDYSGLGTPGQHAYLDGETAARNVLDARRAAAELDGLDLSDTTVIWGHSQGGNAALWAAALATDYAPDLKVEGAAAAAPAADLPVIAKEIHNATTGKIITSYLATSWQEAFQLDVESIRTPGYGQVVERIANNCFEGRDALANLAEASQLSSPILRAETAEFDELLHAKTPPARASMPLLVAQGEADQLVGAAQQGHFVARQCDAGQVLDYRTYPGLDHMPLVAADSPYVSDLITWTLERDDGAAFTETCVGVPAD